MKKIIVISLLALFTFGCSCNKENKINKFKNEYEMLNNDSKYQVLNIDQNNSIKYASVEEIIDIIDNKSGVIYLGYPECILCRSAIPSLLQAASETGLGSIYYLNVKDGINDKLYYKISDYVDNKNINTPLVIFVNEGKIIYIYKGTINDKIELSKSETKKLKNIYKDYIYQLSDDLCDESC